MRQFDENFVKDHGLKIMTSKGEFTEEQLKAYNATKAEREKEMYEELREKSKLRQQLYRRCPLFSESMKTECLREKCALFSEGKCSLSGREEAERDTADLICPFNRYKQNCSKQCALYRGGCTLLIK